MDGALALDEIADALGSPSRLPTAEEIEALLAEAEVALLRGGGKPNERLVAAAWFLHSIAGVRENLDIYSEARQRRAAHVAANIFDLASQNSGDSEFDASRYAFAACVNYIAADLTPNAAAVYRREPVSLDRDLETDSTLLALDAARAFLAFDKAAVFSDIRRLRSQHRALTAELEGSVEFMPFGATALVLDAIWSLTTFLTYGTQAQYDAGVRSLERAVIDATASPLVDRWVAANLLRSAGYLRDAAMRTIVPNRPGLANALAMGHPPVSVLWKPQRALLQMEPSPFSPSVSRLVLSFPTSAGKTLLAQLLILGHLEDGYGGVCYVAPTHALCREVRRELDDRKRAFHTDSQRLEVTTPEALFTSLRSDPAAVLEDFTLFVFDEVHVISDKQRGWPAESLLAMLHQLTLGDHHRIVVISAALGDNSEVRRWLAPDQPPLTEVVGWRGPRRLTGVFATEEAPDTLRRIPAIDGRRKPRLEMELRGQLHVRPSAGSTVCAEVLDESVGILTRHPDPDDPLNWQIAKPWDAHTTPHYLRATALARLLIPHGTVLVVQPTRRLCEGFARRLADELENYPETAALAAAVALRMPEGHSLVHCLETGVGFHHAGLPDAVQADLEDATRQGRLQCLVATTALIEGVNFPVRSVIVGDRGTYTRDGWQEILTPSKLLNALGRAGRATRETEGWAFVTHHAAYHENTLAAFDRNVTSDNWSRLSQPDVLGHLWRYERRLRENVDQLFSDSDALIDSFIAHVWLSAALLEVLGRPVDPSSVVDAAMNTLGLQEIPEAVEAKWRSVATGAFAAYERTTPDLRRRWARSGVRLPTAAAIDRVTDEVVARADRTPLASSLAGTLDVLCSTRILMDILDAANETPTFKATWRSPAHPLDAEALNGIVKDWVAGEELVDIAEQHLLFIEDDDYRLQQAFEFVNTTLVHHVPWYVGLVVSWANDKLREAGHETLFAPVGEHIRYGVATSTALGMLQAGVRSRRLATLVSNRTPW